VVVALIPPTLSRALHVCCRSSSEKERPIIHITNDELARRFNYHPPTTDEKIERHHQVREACRSAAEEVIEATGPPSREQSLAITHLEEAMYWANAAIAREITASE
jgi:hypothetical protein